VVRASRYPSLSVVMAACALVTACWAFVPAGASAASSAGQQVGGVAAPTEQPAAPSPTSPQPSSSSPAPPDDAGAELSNERTVTVWAYSESPGRIYAHPDTHAAHVAKVRLYNADGFPEVYMLLSSYTDAEGLEWVRVRIPGRPNGRTGWMSRELLGSFHRTHWRIVVNRSEHRMRVYYSGRLLRIFPVGVGKPSTPTPTGHFWIDERFKLSSPSNPYWPYALGTSDYSTLPEWAGEGVVGIHGPFGEPQRIPGDPSHGLGTPVDVVS
jgi:hypothetical protein